MKQYFEVKLSFFDYNSTGLIEGTYLTQAESIVKATPAVIRRLRILSGLIIRTSSEHLENVHSIKNDAPFWRIKGEAIKESFMGPWVIQTDTEGEAIELVAYMLDLKPEQLDGLSAYEYTKVLL